MDMSNLGFDEALARLIQTDPEELTGMRERVAKEAEDVARYVEEQTADIRDGGRRFRKPFRP